MAINRIDTIAPEREARELEAYFLSGRGNRGESVWDAFNSVTEWVDHKRTSKNAAKVWNSTMEGAGERVKTIARRMLAK